MDHQTAADSNAVERYTLGEMSADEREAFEEHYFDCRECAAGVRAAEKFADGVRTLPPIEQVPGRSRTQRANWWAAAAAIFAVAFGVQTWRAPRAHQTAAPPPVHFVVVDDQDLPAPVRGAEPHVIVVPRGEPFVLTVPITSDLGEAPTFEVRDATRTIANLGRRQVEPRSTSVSIELNVDPGNYTIVARGNNSVREYPITVRPR